MRSWSAIAWMVVVWFVFGVPLKFIFFLYTYGKDSLKWNRPTPIAESEAGSEHPVP